MAGLKFYTGLTAGSPTGGATMDAPPATAAEAAWGLPGTGAAVRSGGGRALSPSHPAGLSFWFDVAAVVAIVVLWRSLPA